MELTENELKKRLMIQDASFLTASEKILIQDKIEDSNQLSLLTIKDISSLIQRDITRAKWNGKQLYHKANTALFLINNLGINYTFCNDEDYPAMLREMKDPPFCIFYRGDLNCLKNECVSVVGTRKAGYYGRKAAHDFAKDACDSGFTVVSGLAYGIDIESHRGALEGKSAKTAAVLPGGIDTIVPHSHAKTAASIIQKGGVILSEYTPGTPAQNFRFVQRNRIIAALSPATVVIQAPAGSGAMITASLALDYNRYVFFHEACFNEESQKLKFANEHDLRIMALSSKSVEQKVKNKLLNSPQKYVEDGALIIKNFMEYNELKNNDFCDIKIRTDRQLKLFKENDE